MPGLLKKVAFLLLPPECREEILGDLSERYPKSREYARALLAIVPFIFYRRFNKMRINHPNLLWIVLAFAIGLLIGSTAFRHEGPAMGSVTTVLVQSSPFLILLALWAALLIFGAKMIKR